MRTLTLNSRDMLIAGIVAAVVLVGVVGMYIHFQHEIRGYDTALQASLQAEQDGQHDFQGLMETVSTMCRRGADCTDWPADCTWFTVQYDVAQCQAEQQGIQGNY